MIVQTFLVCEMRDGLATIVATSGCTCFQEILTEVNENIQQGLTEVNENIQEVVDNIQEILTEVDGNGDNLVTPGCTNFKWNEKQQVIDCNIDIELRNCLFSLMFICQRGQEIIVLKR